MNFITNENSLNWNKFVESSQVGDILQIWEWGEVKKNEGWKPFRFSIEENGETILVAQCLIKKIKFLGSYLYIPHGPVYKNIENKKFQEALQVFKTELLKFAKSQNCFVIEIEPKIGNLISGKESKNLLPFLNQKVYKSFLSAGFKQTKRNTQPKYKLLYDLELSNEELLMQMKKTTRYNIKVAHKKAVVIKEYWPDDEKISEKLKSFYDLLKAMQKRAKGYPIRPFSSFEKLFKNFYSLKNILLIEASYNKDLIAINISQRVGSWSSSFYAGSNRNHPQTKAMYLLRWQSILGAKEAGCKVYDFWGIIPKAKEHKGYTDNKLSFGGVRIDHVGILSLPINKTKYFFWDKLIPFRSKINKLFRK